MADTANSSPKLSGLTIISGLIRRMVGRTGNRRGLMAGCVLEIGGIILGLGGPYALKVLVDVVGKPAAAPSTVIVCAIVFVGAWAGGTILTTWRMVYSTSIVNRITADLAAAMVRSQLPKAATARDADSGASTGLIERLPYSLSILVDGLIWRTVPLSLQFLVTLLIVAGAVPAAYAAILGAAMASYAFVTWRAASTFQRVATELNATSGHVSQLAGDIFRNARRVVLNGALDQEITLLRTAYGDKSGASSQMMWALVRASMVQYGVMGVGLSTLLVLSGLDALNGLITPGAFILLQTYAFRLIVPISGIGFILSQTSTALANIGEVLSGDEKGDGSDQVLNIIAPAAISLRDVSFSYGPGLPGLTDVTLDIAPGSFVAIVGPNGSGKSTLAQIIAGLLKPSTGTVRVGGLDLSTISAANRHRIALYVPQFIGLFNRSIAANALYPPTRHTQAEVSDLLTAWQFHEPGRIIDLAGVVGEQGERLSGGQIQKLELARVAGIAAPAIIFDESTSALDPSAEEEIIANLRSRFAGKTTMVMITHRQGVAAKADQVLFMRSGRLLRRGTHAELIKDSGAYATLWAVRGVGG